MSRVVSVPRRKSLPKVIYLSVAHFGLFILLCVLVRFTGFDLLFGAVCFYPCLAILISGGLILVSLFPLISAVTAKRRFSLIVSILLNVTVPAETSFLLPTVVDGAMRIEAARTAPLSEFQAWAGSLISTPSTRPEDDWFPGSSVRVSARLRPFTSHFMVSVERDASGGQEPHVLIIGGGGLSETHTAVAIGSISFVPHDEHKWKTWSDGVYFTFP